MNFDKRIVIDTGTLVSASFRFGSIPSQAYVKALREFAVCISQETLAELETVLHRDKFDRYISLEDRLDFLELYRKNAMLYPVTESVFDCRDPKDDKFLALALSAKAEIIVSSDADLCVLNPYRGIAILKPAMFCNYSPPQAKLGKVGVPRKVWMRASKTFAPCFCKVAR